MSEKGSERRKHLLDLPRTRRILGRASVSIAGGLFVAAPFSLATALDHAEAKDDVGPLATTVTLSPGHSSADLGVLGSLHNDSLTSHGIGVQVEVDRPPELIGAVNTNNPSQLLRPFAALYQDPAGAMEGYKEAVLTDFRHELLKTELGAGAALAAFAFMIMSIGSELSPKHRKQLLYGTFGSTALISSLAGHQIFNHWQQENALPSETYPVASLDSSKFGQVVANNQTLAELIDNAAPIITKQKEREEIANKNFLARAYHDIDTAIAAGKFTPPESNETAILALSDLHSNQVMIKVYQYLVDKINETYGGDTIKLTVMVGDQTYGSAVEKGSIDAMAKISDEVYAISGNHDGPIIEHAEKASGIKLLTGEAVTTDDGVKLLGNADPTLTKLSALFGFGKNIPREEDGKTQIEAGEELLKEAEKTNPTIAMSHEAYELGPLLNIPLVSQATMADWFKTVLPPPDDLPAAAVLYGHWHDGLWYKIVRDKNGYGMLAAQLDTAGGASGSMSLSTLSFPWTTPAQKASGVIITVDAERNLVTRLQEFATSPNGTNLFEPATEITQPDPDPTDDLFVKKNSKNEEKTSNSKTKIKSGAKPKEKR